MIKLTIETADAFELMAYLKQITQEIRPLLPQSDPGPARYIVTETHHQDGFGVHAKAVQDD